MITALRALGRADDGHVYRCGARAVPRASIRGVPRVAATAAGCSSARQHCRHAQPVQLCCPTWLSVQTATDGTSSSSGGATVAGSAAAQTTPTAPFRRGSSLRNGAVTPQPQLQPIGTVAPPSPSHTAGDATPVSAGGGGIRSVGTLARRGSSRRGLGGNAGERTASGAPVPDR